MKAGNVQTHNIIQVLVVHLLCITKQVIHFEMNSADIHHKTFVYTYLKEYKNIKKLEY